MSAHTPSRATLQTVLDALATADMQPRQRQDMASVVRTVARLLEAEPSAIDLDVQRLRQRLEGIAPAAHGLSSGRWNNIRSLVGKAISIVRPVLPGRSVIPIREDWLALVDQLPIDRATRLKPVLRFLSERQIGPADVTLDDIRAYRDAIHADRLRANPEEGWKAVMWAWEASGREIAGWPALPFEKKEREGRYVMPWSAFPPSLKEEVDRFIDRLAGRDFDEDGPPRPARPETLKKREYQLRQFASALVLAGHPVESLGSIGAMLQLRTLLDGLRWHYERAGRTVTTQVSQLRDFLKGVARHWVKMDADALAEIDRKTRKLVSRPRGMTAKNRGRLMPFENEANVQAFLSLPETLRAEVEKGKMPARHAAVHASLAVAIAILQTAPLRRQNLSSIEFDRNLVRQGARWFLLFDESETKNSNPLEYELPQRAIDMLDWYVRDHRPLLAGPDCKALFPGENGGSKHKQTLGIQLKEVVFRYTGLTVNAHLFRHALGKIYLDREPGGLYVLSKVLGHTSPQTTQSSYAGMEGRAASQHFARTIEKARQRTQSIEPLKRRRRA